MGEGEGDSRFLPLPLAPSRQGRENCNEELSLHLLFRRCEASGSETISDDEDDRDVASLRSR